MKNSMKGLFVFAGARPRKPAQYFFTSKGLERCSKDPVDSLRNLSNMARNSDDLEEEKRLQDLEEKIHFTVRIMLGKRIGTCAALDKYEATVDDSTVSWRLYHKAFNDVESRLLERRIEARAEVEGSRADKIYPAISEPGSVEQTVTRSRREPQTKHWIYIRLSCQSEKMGQESNPLIGSKPGWLLLASRDCREMMLHSICLVPPKLCLCALPPQNRCITTRAGAAISR